LALRRLPFSQHRETDLAALLFKLKSRERQLINDKIAAVRKRLATAKGNRNPLPAGVRFSPALSNRSRVFHASRQGLKRDHGNRRNHDVDKRPAGHNHFQPKSIN